MSKWYMVKVTTVSMLLIEVADEANQQIEEAAACQLGMDNTSGNDVEAEVDGAPITAGSAEFESAKRHADQVLPL